MDPTFKTEVRAQWHAYVQARVGPPPQPMSEAWQHWILLQQSLARFGPSFHGAIQACHKIGPDALIRCVAALESGHESVARSINHVGTFSGS
jgi:hypothetical protein